MQTLEAGETTLVIVREDEGTDLLTREEMADGMTVETERLAKES